MLIIPGTRAHTRAHIHIHTHIHLVITQHASSLSPGKQSDATVTSFCKCVCACVYGLENGSSPGPSLAFACRKLT